MEIPQPKNCKCDTKTSRPWLRQTYLALHPFRILLLALGLTTLFVYVSVTVLVMPLVALIILTALSYKPSALPHIFDTHYNTLERKKFYTLTKVLWHSLAPDIEPVIVIASHDCKHAFHLNAGVAALPFKRSLVLVGEDLFKGIDVEAPDSELRAALQPLTLVLAHEVAHVRHRHSLQRAVLTVACNTVLLGLTSMLTNFTGPVLALIYVALSLALALFAAYISRNHEIEADTAILNHGTPTQFGAMLDKLVNARKRGKTIGLLRSHPSVALRIAALKSLDPRP